MKEVILMLVGGIAAFGTEFGRLIRYSVADKAMGVAETAERFIKASLMLVKLTVIMTLITFAIGIATGRFGMMAGTKVTIILALVTLIFAAPKIWACLCLRKRLKKAGKTKNTKNGGSRNDADQKTKDITYEISLVESKIGARLILMLSLIGIAVAMSKNLSADQEEVGQGLIAVATVIGALGFTALFRFRAMLGIEATRLASVASHAISGKIPEIPITKTDSLFRWLSGYCAWAALLGLIAQVVPLYRSLSALGAVATCIMLLAAAYSAGWSKTDLMKKMAVNVAMVGAAVALLSLAFPGAFRGIRNHLDFGMETAAESAVNERLELALVAEKTAIENAVVVDCGGQFAGPCEQYKTRYAELVERKIPAAKAGTFIRQQAGISTPDNGKGPSGWVIISIVGGIALMVFLIIRQPKAAITIAAMAAIVALSIQFWPNKTETATTKAATEQADMTVPAIPETTAAGVAFSPPPPIRRQPSAAQTVDRPKKLRHGSFPHLLNNLAEIPSQVISAF
ncbi:hypothetical protein JW899_00830 [Candidatus Uhrbacteria bacterium]|nr:hypothetical protein [Candidatus Uhrbacteria bacterium]